MDIVKLIRGRIADGRRVSDGDALEAANEVERLRGLLAQCHGMARETDYEFTVRLLNECRTTPLKEEGKA